MSKVGIKELATILAKKRKLDSEAALAFVESFFDVLCDSLRDEKMVKVKKDMLILKFNGLIMVPEKLKLFL